MVRQREMGRDGVFEKHEQKSQGTTQTVCNYIFSQGYFKLCWCLETQSGTNQYETVVVVQTWGVR